jgi:midasin
VGAVPSELLLLSAASWFKADRYYYRSLSRLQRLQAAAKQPHRDLVLQEVTAAVAYLQHQMFLMRQQRSLLQQLSDSFTQLLQAASWLQGAAGQYACTSNRNSSGSSSSSVLPTQDWAKGWLLSSQELLCGLTYQLSAYKQLLAAVAPMQQASGLPAHVTTCSSTAVRSLAAWTAALQQHKAAVQAEAGALELGSCPVVSHAAVAAVAAAMAAVSQLRAEAAAATAAMAAAARAADSSSSSSGNAEVVCQMLPAWDRVLGALQAAAHQAEDFQREQQQQHAQQLQQQQQQQGGSVSDPWGACFSHLVSQVLVAAQVLHGSNNSTQRQQQQPDADEAAAAAAAAVADVAAVGQAAAEALKPSRLAAIAATARELLTLLAAASNSSTEAAAMAAQVAAVLPLLLLLLGGLQRSACALLVLHKSLGKLSYITSSIFCTLVTQGYCVPEGEGAEGGEGGEGEMQWQEAGGTGVGDGTGKKDVSDQLTDEDQLLGAQQKDQQQQDQQQEQQQGPDEDGPQGVEMEADFDGSLHDIDDRKQQGEGEDEESQEGDEDRIDQQMGEVSTTVGGGKGGAWGAGQGLVCEQRVVNAPGGWSWGAGQGLVCQQRVNAAQVLSGKTWSAISNKQVPCVCVCVYMHSGLRGDRAGR